MRTRIAAVLAAVVALLAPAAAAHAAPAHSLDVYTYSTALYPAVDGYLDSTTIAGSVDPADPGQPVRGTVTISVGGRIIKSFPLTRTGHFEFIWNGRAGNGTIVPGVARVAVRVDGQISPAATTIAVSPKKLVKVTRTTVQAPWISMHCRDDKLDSITGDAWFAYFGKICATERDARQTILRLKLRGTVSVGPIVWDGSVDKTGPSAIDTSPIPAVTSVTIAFTQSGSGSNMFFICEDSDCSIPTSSALRTFSQSGTYTSTGRAIGGSYPYWRVIVPHGHDLSFSKITITTVYYVLK